MAWDDDSNREAERDARDYEEGFPHPDDLDDDDLDDLLFDDLDGVWELGPADGEAPPMSDCVPW